MRDLKFRAWNPERNIMLFQGGISMTTKLGEALRNKRRKENLTQKDLSSRLGISMSYLCEIEKNKKFPQRGKALKNIAKFLETTEYDIFKSYDEQNIFFTKQELKLISMNIKMASAVRKARDYKKLLIERKGTFEYVKQYFKDSGLSVEDDVDEMIKKINKIVK